MPPREGIYGLLAEFNTPGELVHATEKARQRGLSPHGVLHALSGGRGGGGAATSKDPRAAGLPAGRADGRDDGVPDGDLDQGLGYPLNIAGRPLFSWPAFIIPAYEWTILFAGLSAAFGMIALNGLPQLYHPVFNAPNFRNGATTDKFFLCLEAADPKFSLTETRAFLEQFPPVSVVEVDH